MKGSYKCKVSIITATLGGVYPKNCLDNGEWGLTLSITN